MRPFRCGTTFDWQAYVTPAPTPRSGRDVQVPVAIEAAIQHYWYRGSRRYASRAAGGSGLSRIVARCPRAKALAAAMPGRQGNLRT
jgi:hypothetical protein